MNECVAYEFFDQLKFAPVIGSRSGWFAVFILNCMM